MNKSTTGSKSPYSRSRTMPLGNLRGIGGYDQFYVNNGVTTKTAYNMSVVATDTSTKTMVDWVTPGYAQRVADGEIVNNPMTSVTTLYENQGSSTFRATGTVDTTNYTWIMELFPRLWVGRLAPVGVQHINLGNLQRLCQTAALAGVQAPTLQGLAAIGEGHSTLAMLANPLKGFSKILGARLKIAIKANKIRKFTNSGNAYLKSSGRAVVMGNPRSIYNGKGVIVAGQLTAAAVLGYNLGWRPLLMDIDAILHKIPNLEDENRRTSRSTKSAHESWTTTQSGVAIPTTGLTATCTQTFDETVKVRAGVLYADSFRPLQHFGMRLVDIPNALWELIPFSFVVDYFVNVADYLDALRAQYDSNILASYTTTEIDTVVTRSYTITGLPYPYTSVSYAPGVARTSQSVKIRTPEGLQASLAYSPLQIGLSSPIRVQNLLGLVTLQLSNLALRKGAF